MQNILNVRRKTIITKRKKVRDNSDNIFVSKDNDNSVIKVSWGRALKIKKVELFTIAGVNVSSKSIGIDQDSVLFAIPSLMNTPYVVKSYDNKLVDIKII